MGEKSYKANRQWFLSLPRGMVSKSDFGQVHKINAFARFRAFPEMLLFSEPEGSPQWAIEQSLQHFCHRFPTFVIALCQKDAGGGTLYCAILRLRELPGAQIAERFESDNGLCEAAYEKFYASQFISTRKNLNTQKRPMPEFFIAKGEPEWKSIRHNKFTGPNTASRDFL